MNEEEIRSKILAEHEELKKSCKRVHYAKIVKYNGISALFERILEGDSEVFKVSFKRKQEPFDVMKYLDIEVYE